jgi:hypothetical protein
MPAGAGVVPPRLQPYTNEETLMKENTTSRTYSKVKIVILDEYDAERIGAEVTSFFDAYPDGRLTIECEGTRCHYTRPKPPYKPLVRTR